MPPPFFTSRKKTTFQVTETAIYSSPHFHLALRLF
jgi:hypothetical protein